MLFIFMASVKNFPSSTLGFVATNHILLCSIKSNTEKRIYEMSLKILRLKDVLSMTGLSRSTVYVEIAKGNFPKQIKLTGNRSVGWHESAIIQWIESRQQA